MRVIVVLFFMSLLAGCTSESKVNLPAKQPDTSAAFPNVKKVEAVSIDSSLVVFDTASKLCWMKQDFSFMKSRFLNEWKEVFEWQKEINKSNYAGFNDWVVPDINQYRTINKTKQERLLYKKNFIQLDTACVWGNGPYSFWSATTPNKHTASYISFIDGFATSGDRGKQFSNPYSSWKGVELGMSVRLVRIMK